MIHSQIHIWNKSKMSAVLNKKSKIRIVVNVLNKIVINPLAAYEHKVALHKKKNKLSIFIFKENVFFRNCAIRCSASPLFVVSKNGILSVVNSV